MRKGIIYFITIISMFLHVYFTPIAIAKTSGNIIDEREYPKSSDVLPNTDTNSNIVISGSVDKNVNLDLNTCIYLALGNNPRISSAFDDILASDARIKQVWANYFPTLSWQTGYTRLRQLQLSDALGRNLEFNYYLLGQISLQQMLYDFGVTQNQATIRKLDYENLKKAFEATVNDVIFQTKSSYFTVLYAYENRKVALDAVNKFSLFYKQAKAYYITGKSPKVDVTIAETNLSNAKLRLIQAENSVNIALANLNYAMGLPYLKNYVISERLEYKPLDLSFEDMVKFARESRPELKQAEIKVEQMNQTIKLAKKSYFPTISLEGQYQRGGRTWNSNYGFNIGGYLTFPAVNMMLVKNEIKEAKALYSKELANAKKTQYDIYLELQKAYLKLLEKKNQLPVAKLQQKQANENFNLSFRMYGVGVGAPSEVKDAEVTYENAQLTYYSSIYEYNIAKAELEKAIGRNLCQNEDYISLSK
ncbi:TolC family protein [bacterium]|nr:TolC family protein [bacterium]